VKASSVRLSSSFKVYFQIPPDDKLPRPETHYCSSPTISKDFRLTARPRIPILTRFQKLALLGLSLLMLADLSISSWGVLYSPVFSEANAFFAQFVQQPLEFIAVVGLSKILVIGGLIVATIWFNRREKSSERWRGGDIICSTAFVCMAAMMLILVIGNLVAF
jgi:hypothetical protein